MLEIFQISAALLVSLTGLTSAIVEGIPIAALTIPIALATWYFVDRMNLIWLPEWLAPFLGLGAFIAAAYEYFYIHESSHLFAGNHLLAYLTWIFLFQRKEVQHYWWIFALSILQIAVTALLTYSIWFGIALLAYSLLATWTLSIFLLYRSVKFLKEDDSERATTGREASSATGVGRFWSGVSRDRHERLVTTRFSGSTVSVTGISLVIAILFFLFIPRVWPNARYVEGGAPGNPLTGFSTEVRLGDMGEILESKDKVMDVRIFNRETGLMLSEKEARTYWGIEPLFRGAVLEEYQQGRWHQAQPKPSRKVDAHIDEAQYRMQIKLQPLNTGTLFSFGNMVGAEPVKDYGSLTWDYFSNELQRGEDTDFESEFEYNLYTNPGSPDTWLYQQRLRDLQSFISRGFRRSHRSPMSGRRYGHYLNSLIQLPPDLHELREITMNVIGSESSTSEAARKIENWLRHSGEFTYSMKLSKSSSPLDPILDFLKNRRRGHCEYFASAMATMLRSVQIPSRVITGFKGGVFLPESNMLTVQQLHAHAWVEAFIDGHWVTFDPTPGARDEAVQSIENHPSNLFRFWRIAQLEWHQFASLSNATQRASIYQPLVENLVQAKTIARNLMQGRTDWVKKLLNFLRQPERWISIEGGFLALVIMLLMSGLYWLVKHLYLASRSLTKYMNLRSGSGSAQTPRVPFFERFAELLRQRGLHQRPNQTAMEFVHASLPELEVLLSIDGESAWPEELVEKFYQVRFGRKPLSLADLEMLEQHLDELEASLQTSMGSDS